MIDSTIQITAREILPTSLRSRDLGPTLNPVSIRRSTFDEHSFPQCGDAVVSSPCCSWPSFRKGLTLRPFECQTASRGTLDVSAPYALSPHEPIWMGGRTGRWFSHNLHVLATRIVVVLDLSHLFLFTIVIPRTPEIYIGHEC